MKSLVGGTLSIGSRVELKDFERVSNQHGKKIYSTLRMDVKKQKWNKRKGVQVEELEDMYLEKNVWIYVLNPKEVLPVTKNIFSHLGCLMKEHPMVVSNLEHCRDFGFGVGHSITKGVVLGHC